MISTKMVILAPLWGLGVVWTGIVGYSIGPDLEEKLSPVITDQTIVSKWRDGDMACWQWNYHKARTVKLIVQSYYVERGDGIRFPVAEIRADLGIPTNDSTTAKGGETRTVPKCIFLPPTMRGVAYFSIHGGATYSPWHHLWELRQDYLPVEITPDIPKEQPPDVPSVHLVPDTLVHKN